MKGNSLARPTAVFTRALRESLDLRTATLGAVAMAGAVYWMNYTHGTLVAMVPAFKQALYTFFVAGLIARNNEKLAVMLESRWWSLALAVFVSSGLAIGLTFFVHSLRGTPEPIWSTVPTIVAAPPGFAVLAWRYQQQARL